MLTKIINNPTPAVKIAQKLVEILKHLDSVNYVEGITRHHGVSYNCGRDTINISDKGGMLQVILQITKEYRGNDVWYGYNESTHTTRKRKIAEAIGSKLIDSWDGAQNNATMTLVFDRDCPKCVYETTVNYHKTQNVFKFTEADKIK